MSWTRYTFSGLLLVTLVVASTLAPMLAQAAPPTQEEDRKAQADALYDEGMGQYYAGEYQTALEKWHAALEIYREIGNRKGERHSLTSIGVVYSDLGQYEEAIRSKQGCKPGYAKCIEKQIDRRE